MFSGDNFLNDVNERPTSTNGRELPGVAHQYVAVNIRTGVKQSSELVFGEHRAFVNDHSTKVTAPWRGLVWKVRSGLSVVASILTQKLGKCTPRSALFCLFFEADTGLSGRR